MAAADGRGEGDQATVLRQRDRICFLGDSITAADPGYSRLTAAMLCALRPDLQLGYVFAGVSGDRVGQLLARLDRDVLREQPTMVTVSIGINDVWHRHGGGNGGGTADAEFAACYAQLCDRLEAAGIRGVLLTPTVIGEELGRPENRELQWMVGVVRRQAAARGWPLADMHAAFAAAITARRQALCPAEWPMGPDGDTRFYTVDGVHMNAAGNALMATTLVDALCAPGVRLGGSLPPLGLRTAQGEATTLENVRAGGPAVAYWYPKDATSGCTLEARAFQALLPEFRRAGVQVCGLSCDPPESHRAFAADCGLEFTLLVDPDGRLARAAGQWNAERGWPRRSTFLLGADGRVLRIWQDVRPEGHAEEVLETVRALLGA